MIKADEETGRRLGADHARQFQTLKRTQSEIFSWAVLRITEGESLYAVAKVLGMSRSALERRLSRAGIDYTPKTTSRR